MPTRIQPSMDLQLVPSGMGPAMMKLDLGIVKAADVAQIEFIEEFLPLEPAFIPSRWQRIWTVLNMDVKDVWGDLIAWWRQKRG